MTLSVSRTLTSLLMEKPHLSHLVRTTQNLRQSVQQLVTLLTQSAKFTEPVMMEQQVLSSLLQTMMYKVLQEASICMDSLTMRFQLAKLTSMVTDYQTQQNLQLLRVTRPRQTLMTTVLLTLKSLRLALKHWLQILTVTDSMTALKSLQAQILSIQILTMTDMLMELRSAQDPIQLIQTAYHLHFSLTSTSRMRKVT